MGDARLAIGLGNSGTRYARNRHNIGYMMLDVLTGCTGSRFSQHKKAHTCVAEGRLDTMSGGALGPRVTPAEPPMLMSPPDDPVTGFVSYYGIDPANRLLVIHDGLDLPTHELRLKRGDGKGGHSGPCSIGKFVSTKDYTRLRIGVSRPPGRQDPSDFILSDPPGRERADPGATLEQVADAVEQVVTVGFDNAQQRLHAPH